MGTNDQAFPGLFRDPWQNTYHSRHGLTKREYFAAMAMQGLIATGREQTAPWGLAHDAVCCADSLLAALARKDTP